MAEFFDIPTLIIIGIAIFVLMRLRNVLGTRTGNERKPGSKSASMSKNQKSSKVQAIREDDVVVPLHPDMDPNSEQEELERAARKFDAELDKAVGDNKELRKGLVAISQVDDAFTPKIFLEGAGSAYEMIVTAFAAGDKRSLKDLLEKDVFEGFESAIDLREKEGKSVDFTFVGLSNIEFLQAELEKNIASLTLRFDADIVSATKDKDQNTIEGHDEQVVNIADEWTFARNTRSRDPNWKLVATDQIN